jgi:hypothetical protein
MEVFLLFQIIFKINIMIIIIIMRQLFPVLIVAIMFTKEISMS